jgi:hypothetical protein
MFPSFPFLFLYTSVLPSMVWTLSGIRANALLRVWSPQNIYKWSTIIRHCMIGRRVPPLKNSNMDVCLVMNVERNHWQLVQRSLLWRDMIIKISKGIWECPFQPVTLLVSFAIYCNRVVLMYVENKDKMKFQKIIFLITSWIIKS